MKTLLMALTVIAGIAASGVSSPAAVDSTDILIKALVNKGVITEDDAASVRAEIANIRQEEEANRKSYGVTSKRPIKIGGYLQERYTHSSQTGFNDTLETKRLRLTVGGDATEKVDFNLQMDFAGSKNAVTGVNFTESKTSTAALGRPALLDADIGCKVAGNSRLDVGQFKIPFSMESLRSDAYLDLINRPRVVEALVPGRDTGNQGRDIGVQFSSVRKLNEDGTRQLQYYAGVFNGSGINITDDNDRKDPALRVVLLPGVEGLSLGASYYNGRTGATRIAHDRTGGELAYNLGPWTLRGEYIAGTDATVDKKGWYATLVREFAPNLQGVVRLDHFDLNTSTPNNDVSTFTTGVNHFLNKDGYNRLQLNYERRKDDPASAVTNSVLAQFQAGF